MGHNAEHQDTPGGAPTLTPGSRVGRYRVLERLGAGGMAEVYVAVARGIGRFEKIVAIKRVLPHLRGDADLTRMFLDEARLVATLDHPNVAQVIEVGGVEGEYFFAMEYLHGHDVRAVLQRSKTRAALPLGCAIEIALGVARGLHHAHERRGADGTLIGLVHRDVSPSNVMVTYEGSVKLVDFGIAKAAILTRQTRAGALLGKAGYMSPEQCIGESADRRSDIFALGILLYECTTQRRAFVAESELGTMNRIIHGRWIRPTDIDPDFPPQLAAIIERALQTDPSARYQTAREFADDLEAFALEHKIAHSPAVLASHMTAVFDSWESPTTRTSLALTRTPSTARRSPTLWRTRVAGAVVGLVAGVGMMLLLLPGRDSRADAAVSPAMSEITTAAAPPIAESAPAAVRPTPTAVPAAPKPLASAPPEVAPAPSTRAVDDGPEARAAPSRAEKRRRVPRKSKPVVSRPSIEEDLYPPSHHGKIGRTATRGR